MRLNAAQQRDFEDYVRGRSSALLRTALLLTGDRACAEDLLQLALERLARHWRRLDDQPDAYVRRTLVNLATDRWRMRSRRPQQDRSELLEGHAVAADAHRQVEQRLDLVRAMRTLTARQRAVLVLRYFDDLSEADTARVMGCSIGTVKSTASRALTLLREQALDPAPAPAPALDPAADPGRTAAPADCRSSR